MSSLVEPGTFPLAHGAPNRVGRLRGYGNAIVPTQDPISSTDASEDGTGRGTPLVPVAMINMQGSKGNAVAQADGPSFTLTAMHDTHAVAVPVGVTIHGTDPTVQKVASYDELAQCLRARTPGNIDNSSTTVVQQPVAFHPTQDPISSTDGSTHALGCGSTGGQASVAVAVALRGREGVRRDTAPSRETRKEVTECAGTLAANCGGLNRPAGNANELDFCVTVAMQVRRLTPVECERLQGFPDDYTAIPWRGKPASECPDGPRYQALGNSMAVPCMRWIGQRIQSTLNHI